MQKSKRRAKKKKFLFSQSLSMIINILFMPNVKFFDRNRFHADSDFNPVAPPATG
jgi:hypothetical protein